MNLKRSFNASLILLSVIAPALSQTTNELILSKYNAESKVISGIQYPRVYESVYRGLKTWELSEVEVMQAMLGDETKTINSSAFQSLSDKFQGIANKYLVESLNLLSDEQKNIFANVSNESMGLLGATKATDTLINSELTSMSADDFKFLLSDEYGNPNPFFLYSTVYFDFAKHYSDRIIMIDQSIDKVDLNFWRSQNGSNWREWPADTGEFIIPSHVPAKSIIGYYDVSKRKHPDNTKNMFSIPVSYSFFKMKIEGEEYIINGCSSKFKT